jgi:beta-lactam-binding protein with PASTA domain
MQFPQIAIAPSGPGASPTAGTRGTPNVVGRDVNDAAGILLAAGFKGPEIPWQVDPSGRGTPCSVLRQEPKAGDPYQAGASAKLFLAPGKDCSKRD